MKSKTSETTKRLVDIENLSNLFTKEEKIKLGKKVFEICCRIDQMNTVNNEYHRTFRCGRCTGTIISQSNYYAYRLADSSNKRFFLKFRGYSRETFFQLVYDKKGDNFTLKHLREECDWLYKFYPECYDLPITEDKIFFMIFDCLIKSFALMPKKNKDSDKTPEDLLNAIENAMI